MDEGINSALIEQLRARKRWDESADIGFVCGETCEGHLGEVKLHSFGLQDHLGEVKLHSFGLPEECWAAVGDPVLALGRTAAGLAAYHQLPSSLLDGLIGKPPLPALTASSFAMAKVPASFAGAYFRFEAWSADLRPWTPLPQKRLRRASAEHDLHLQPERVESRHLMAVGTDGTLYWVVQERGEPDPHSGLKEATGEAETVLDYLTRLTMELKILATAEE